MPRRRRVGKFWIRDCF